MLKPSDFEAWRKQHKMTQLQAAEYIGISRRAWQKYEQGTSEPPDCVPLAMAARDYNLSPQTVEIKLANANKVV